MGYVVFSAFYWSFSVQFLKKRPFLLPFTGWCGTDTNFTNKQDVFFRFLSFLKSYFYGTLLRDVCLKHYEIAKGCPEYISSVVKVSCCSNQKTFCHKLSFLGLDLFSFVRISILVLLELKTNIYVTIHVF